MQQKQGFLEKHNSILLPILLAVVDYCAIVMAEEGAFLLRKFVLRHGAELYISWINFWIVFPFLYQVFIHSERLYSTKLRFWQVIQHMFRACCYGIIAVVVELYISQTAENTSRLFVLVFGIMSFISLVCGRFAVKLFLEYSKVLYTPVLIIGAGKTAELMVKSIENEMGLGYRIAGLLEDNEVTSERLKKYPVLGHFDDLEKVLQNTEISYIIIAAPGVDPYKQGELIYRARPYVKNVAIIPNLIGMPMGELEVESLFSEKLMLLKIKNNLARPYNRLVKLFFDYVLTFFGTLLISPFLLLIAAWIYKDSPGPIIFKHERVGKDGKKFPCYKFRTMCVDADVRLKELLEHDPEAKAEWDASFKLKNDPRITKSGAFLRRTSLDELPQIFNVLRGEMSLVGPRPVVEAEIERYGIYARDYYSVRPGITGYWQISGRSDTTYEERVMMDSWYVQNWSVWLDVMLLWRTFKSVLKQEGAY